ncbi:hypothetical protein ACHAXR_002079 [Thalassiosira sp. AJA248-18]
MSTYLKRRRDLIESNIFTTSGRAQSKVYTLDGFLNTLKDLTTGGIDGMMFYIGQGAAGNFDHGLVNIALFLAHAMTRGISWDTCEEVNHHLVEGKLPLSNSCGQHGRLYSNDICPLADAAMECAVDESMNVLQASVGNSGSPPFFCAPKSTHPFTGYYDPLSDQTVSSTPFANEGGRVDVSGCCFWGRGILLNQGVCDIGRFNYIYGLPAFMDGRSSGRYTIDFCSHPEALCSDFTIPATEFNKFPATVDTSDVRYLIGLLYWVDYVQDYTWGYWNYFEKLQLFVDGGMKDDSFVDEFSEIVVDSSRDGALRKANFKKVLDILFTVVYTSSPTTNPTISPTNKPTKPPFASAPGNLPGGVPSKITPDGASAPPVKTSVDGTPLPGTAGAFPGEQDPGVGVGPISNPYLQPGASPISNGNQPAPIPNSKPNRPVSINLSAPRPNILPSNTVNIGLNSNDAPFHGSGVLAWASFFLQFIFICYCQ